MMRHEDPSKFFTMRDKGVERKWQRERREKEERRRERENTPQNGAGCWKSISDPLTAEILPKKKLAINSDFLGVCA